MDKKAKRILYGEAEKDLVDFLFTLLSLPLATLVQLLSTEPMAWSLASLHRSAQPMNVLYLHKSKGRLAAAKHHINKLLNPKLPATTLSQLESLSDIQSSSLPNTHYYTCDNTADCRYSFSSTYCTTCPRCSKSMACPATFVDDEEAGEGGYVEGEMFTYMVMDDLTVKPNSCSSMFVISVLNELNVEDVGQIEEKLIYLDMNEGVKLLKASLHSSTVLNDVFLHRIDFSATHDIGMKRKKGKCDPVDEEKVIKKVFDD